MAGKITLDSFILVLAEAMEGSDPKTLKAATEFRKHPQWDSLAAVMTLSGIDDAYGIQLPADELRASTTIEELFNAVSKKLNA